MSIDQRKEPRYNVPDPCQQYINLKVKRGTELVPAVIGNFSRNGILFGCSSVRGTALSAFCELIWSSPGK
jgi:hypothetical protein